LPPEKLRERGWLCCECPPLEKHACEPQCTGREDYVLAARSVVLLHFPQPGVLSPLDRGNIPTLAPNELFQTILRTAELYPQSRDFHYL